VPGPVSTSSEVHRRSSGWFFVWVAVGFVATLGILVFGSPGVVLVGGVSVLLARRPAVRRAAFGASTGAGLVLLFVAYQNRQGPGSACWRTAAATGCDQHLNPWPWLVAGMALVAAGLIGQVVRGRSGRQS
jgi:hypothetical protein